LLLFYLVTISLIINVIFLFNSFIEAIINPKYILTIPPLCNISLFVFSILLLSLHNSSTKFNLQNQFLESFLISVQVFRFFFLIKYVKFMKKFMQMFKKVLIKSFPIMVFFIIIWFFYSLIGIFVFINDLIIS